MAYLIELGSGTANERTIHFRLFTSDGTSPDTGASNDSVIVARGSATTFTPNVLVTAVHAAQGMYSIQLTQSDVSNHGQHAVYHVQGDFPQHVANFDVVNFNPFSDQSNIPLVATVTDVTNQVTADMTAISGDGPAADNLETMLDGTGGQLLTLGQLYIAASGNSSAIHAIGSGSGNGIFGTGGNTSGAGIIGTGGTSGNGIRANSGGGSAAAIFAAGASTGQGIRADGGSAGAPGMLVQATGGNDAGFEAIGNGTGSDISGALGEIAANVITAGVIATDAIDADALATDAVNEIVDQVWDEATADHEAADSFGQSSQILEVGVLQGGTTTEIQLASDATATNDFYNNALVMLEYSTGYRIGRIISDYTGSNQSATLNRTLPVAAASGVTYWIYPETPAFVPSLDSVGLAAQTHSGATVEVSTIANDAITAAVIATDAIDADAIADNAIDAAAIAADAITAAKIADGAIDAATFAAGAVDAAALAQDAAQEIADEVINRDIATGSSGGARNVQSALRYLRNRVDATSGSVLTVYQENDSTSAWTASITTSDDPSNINEINPQ